jgi:hypothetical protein
MISQNNHHVCLFHLFDDTIYNSLYFQKYEMKKEIELGEENRD